MKIDKCQVCGFKKSHSNHQFTFLKNSHSFKAVTIKAPLESEEQTAYVQIIRAKYPKLRFYAVPNGGWRHPKTARDLKAQGVSPGVPDIVFPAPRWKYFGFYQEMKRREDSTTSDEQKEWLAYLEEVGYCTGVAYGQDEAISQLDKYLSLGPCEFLKGRKV